MAVVLNVTVEPPPRRKVFRLRTLVGLIVGAFSVASLVQHAFEVGLRSVLQRLLEYYDYLTALFLAPLEPWLAQALRPLMGLFGWDLTLYPHWRHVFVLALVYFRARAEAGRVVSKPGERGIVVFQWILGVTLAAIVGLLAGTIPLVSGPGEIWKSMALAFIAITGALFFDLGEITWSSLSPARLEALGPTTGASTGWDLFKRLSRKALTRFAVGVLAILMAILANEWWFVFKDVPSPGLAMLLVWLIALGLYWLYQGTLSVRRKRGEDETWLQAYLRMGATQIGLILLSTVGFGLVYVLAGAGPIR